MGALYYKPLGNKIIYKLSKWFCLVLIIQLIYGAFTAGLKAGYYIDPQSSLNTIFGYFNTKEMRNLDFINNPLNVQFIHRSLAWVIALFAFYIWYKSRKTMLNRIGNIYFSIVIAQIILGISTIILGIDKYLAIMHQFFGCILLLMTIYLIHQSQPNEKS